MRLIVALALLATVYGSSPDECAWGESYWCSSLTTARQCGAFQHCKDTVWAHTKLEKDNTDICEFCEAIIKDTRDFIDDKKNQEEVKTFLTNACNIIPDQKLAEQCKTSVTQEFDQLIQLIDSELDPAKVCSAMGLCSGFKDRIHQKAPLKKSALKEGTDVCEFCEAVIKDIRAFVDDKTNIQQVKDMLDSVCEMIGDEELVNLCKTAVNDEIDQLIQMIDSELDPSVVCKAMGLCAAAKKAPVKIVGDDLCQDCSKFFMEVKSLLSDTTTEQEIQQLIEEQLCARAGQYEAVCKVAVETYLPQIMQMLSSDVDPAKICSALGFCKSTPEARALLANLRLQMSPMYTAVPAGSAETCIVCKTVLGELQSLEANKATQKEVEDFVKKNLCGVMGTLQAVCESTVDKYGPELFELLKSELDPETRCKALGFCAAGTIESVLRASVPKSPPPKIPVSSNEVSKVSDDQSTQCVLCEFVIKTLDSQLSDNATEEAIIKALDKVCDILPDTIKAPCEAVVQQYGPTVIALLLQELDPQQVCTKLGLCTGVSTSNKVSADPPVQCVLCEFVIKTLDSQLSDNATEAEIVKALDEVCDILPDTIKATCEGFVQQYGPTVIALLLQELDPQQVCTKMGLCTGVIAPVKATKKVSASPQCILCQFVMTEIDQLLSNNATQAEIIQALDKICNILPASVTANCLDFVNTYGPAVLALLTQELQPSVICSTLGLCDQKKPEILLKKAHVADDELCGVCETVIQYMDSLIEENATIAEIEQVLDKICNFLPDTMKQQCTDLVQTYGPALIQMIAQFLDPREICTEIGLCSNSTKSAVKESNAVEMMKIVPAKVQLLGENECTWGPAHWCLNMDNALKCNQIDYCKKVVWN